MAAPNLLALTTLTGKSAVYQGTGSIADALANPAASGQSWRVNLITAANNDGTSTFTADIALHKAAGTVRYLGFHIPIQPGGAQVILDRPLTLEEGDSIQCASPGTALKIDFVINYDILY
jgi:hypothetical protein